MPKSERLMRVALKHDEYHEEQQQVITSRMNVLVDWNPKIRIGTAITLKDSEHPAKHWIVQEIYETTNRVDIKIGWNNNI